jgi:hypothetical protein
MNREKLAVHIRLCRKNMNDKRVMCCSNCPFEEEIVREYPDMAAMFEKKRGTMFRLQKRKRFPWRQQEPK